MDGEKQLQALERKEQLVGMQGGSFPNEEKNKLLRARAIEKSASIFSEERSDPIFAAAYQRAVDRGDENVNYNDAETNSKRSSRGYSSEISTDTSETGGGHGYSAEESHSREENSQLVDDSIELAEEEAMLAEQLSIEQESNNINNRVAEAHQEGKSFGKPSKFKYFILYVLAICVDVIDLLGLTGIGLIITTIIAIICTIIMYLIFWFSNTKQKKAANYQKKMESFLQDLQTNVAHIERRSIQISRFVSKYSKNKFIKRLKPVRALRKGAATVIKFARRSPATKFLAAAIANLIPILSFLPWQTIGVWLSYRDENETYKDASKVADSLLAEAPAEV